MLGTWSLLCLISYTFSARILITVTLPGSHLLLSASVAELLSKAGYDVTLHSMVDETRVDMTMHSFKWIVSNAGIDIDFFAQTDMIISDVIDLPSEYMWSDVFLGSERVRKMQGQVLLNAFEYYHSKEFYEILQSGNFDLIIGECMGVFALGSRLYKETSIPLIELLPLGEMRSFREQESLPLLLVSEPNMANTRIHKPTFYERIKIILDASRFYGWIGALSEEIIEKYTAPLGITAFMDMMKVMRKIQMTFQLDHPALSFPYLKPANVFFLGFFHLKDYKPKPLPAQLDNFVTDCDSMNIIYMSFGSYLNDISKVAWLSDVFSALSGSNVCVILKGKENLVDEFNLSKSKFLVQPWVPQKDLLGSGKLAFFLSHCGNNGKLESVYYTVPLLCVPLFGDQLANALMVEKKGFGLMSLKEKVTEATLVELIQTMLEKRDMFARAMGQARDVVLNDPAAGGDTLLFYIDHLLTYGNVDFLRNSVIKEQSIVEIYNLDVLCVFLVPALLFLCAVLTCTYKSVRYFCK